MSAYSVTASFSAEVIPNHCVGIKGIWYIVECKNCGVCAEHGLWNHHAVPIFQSASEQEIEEAHAEVARLTAECERVKEELKEALVGVS